MTKAILFVLTAFFTTSASIAQSGTQINLKITTGSDDLRRNANVFFQLNFTDGTSSGEFVVHRDGGTLGTGFPHDSRKEINIALPSAVNLSNIRSITIRHDGSPRDMFDSYDNWDLQGLQVSLLSRSGISVTSFNIFNSTDRRFVTRFTGDNRLLHLDRQR
jgi:hypothetical protein